MSWYSPNGQHPGQPSAGYPSQYPQAQPGGNPQQPYGQYGMPNPGRGPPPPPQYTSPHQQMFPPQGHGPPGPQQFQQVAPYGQPPPHGVPRGTGPAPNQPYQQARGHFPPMPAVAQPPPPAAQPYSNARSAVVPEQAGRHAPHTSPPHAPAPPGAGSAYSQNAPYGDPRMQQQYGGSHSQSLYSSGSSIPSLQSYPGPQDMQMNLSRDLPPNSFTSGISYPSNGQIDLRAFESAARKAFDSADRDNSGYLDFKEFLDSLRALDLSIPYHYAMQRFAELDKDQDGRIRESEFVNGYLKDRFEQKPLQGYAHQAQQSVQTQSQQSVQAQAQYPQQQGQQFQNPHQQLYNP